MQGLKQVIHAMRVRFWSIYDAQASEKAVEKCRRAIRNSNDLVGCLAVELEVEFRTGLTIFPVGQMLDVPPAQRPHGKGIAPNHNADTRRLPDDAARPGDGLG